MLRIVLACFVIGCGGVETIDQDASTDASTEPSCFETEYGCSFCIPDAMPGVCGNIGRFIDGSLDLGCCVGATPLCNAGICVEDMFFIPTNCKGVVFLAWLVSKIALERACRAVARRT
jgi:hypothetical protein